MTHDDSASPADRDTEHAIGDGQGLPMEVTVAELKQLIDRGQPFTFLDCREPGEYQICQLDGSRLIPIGQLPMWAKANPQHQRDHLVVICHHGVRSFHAVQWLRANGFADSQSVAGGIDQWSQRIDPDVTRY